MAKDWLNRPLPELNVMFGNVEAKIGGYKTAYGLTDAWINKVKDICVNFQSAYAGMMNARATMKDANKWFDSLLNGKPRGAPSPLPPVFAPITIAAGAFIGIIDEFREMMGFFKANAAYTEADGENLMIVSAPGDAGDTENAVPVLKVSVEMNGEVRVEYTKSGFSGLELQWRKVGETVWQMADKSTEKIITFTPEGITPPQNIELRAVYLLKNKRVGQWSPVYSLTLG